MKVNSQWENYLFLQALAVAQKHDPPSGSYWRAVLPGRRTENPAFLTCVSKLDDSLH